MAADSSEASVLYYSLRRRDHKIGTIIVARFIRITGCTNVVYFTGRRVAVPSPAGGGGKVGWCLARLTPFVRLPRTPEIIFFLGTNVDGSAQFT